MPSPPQNPASADTGDLRFHLFIAGSSPRSDRAIENLRRMVDEHLGGEECEVEVIDVLESPERAERDRILATPTLIKEAPLPRRRVTGDLSDSARVLQVVGMKPPGGSLPPSRP